ncbi:hypothetical protein D3C85_985930 [compost metagenome]
MVSVALLVTNVGPLMIHTLSLVKVVFAEITLGIVCVVFGISRVSSNTADDERSKSPDPVPSP